MDSEQSNDPCRIKNKETLDYVAFLLGVSSIDLETALVCRTKLIHRELCTIYLSAEEAVVQRDCLAETLYSLLFSWILELINSRLCKDDCVTFIGILDFYGELFWQIGGGERNSVNPKPIRHHLLIINTIKLS